MRTKPEFYAPVNVVVVASTLSDGSKAYDVHIRQGAARIVLPAIDEMNALRLQLTVRVAIELHTNELVRSA